MKILLTGATGFLGQHIHAALHQSGHDVVPVSRGSGHDFNQLQTAAAWTPLLRGTDAVVNAVGIIGETLGQRFDVLHTRAPQALFEAAHAAGVRCMVQLSAQGADHTAFSAYHQSKRAADDFARSLPRPAWVLRPGLVFGPGGVSQQVFMRLARLPCIPVPGDGQQWVQPVYVGDLVSTIQACLQHSGPGQTLDLVRPEPLTFAAWLETLRHLQGLPPTSLLKVPWPLVEWATALCAPFTPMARRENLRMLRQANTTDATPWLAFWGQTPTEVCKAHLH